MHAYLIIGKDPEKNIKKATEIAQEKGAKLIEFPFKKISDTKILIKFLNLSPAENTAIYLQAVDEASAETLNAFLKNLEEKNNFTFILTARSKGRVLPTILSRCLVVKAELPEVSKEITQKILEFIDSETPQRFLFLEKIKIKKDAVDFVDDLLFEGQNLLKESPNQKKIANILSQGLTLRKMLDGNTNTFLQLTNFVVAIDDEARSSIIR